MKSLSSAIIRVTEDISTEEDPESQCKNYPDGKFTKYKDCDDRFLTKEIKEKLDIVPFWATDQFDEVTKSYSREIDIDLYDYFDGTITSQCFTPCTSTKVSRIPSTIV